MDNTTVLAIATTRKFVYSPCGYKNHVYDSQTEEVLLFVAFLAYALPTQILSIWLFKLIFFSTKKQAFSSPFYSFFGISTIPTILFFLGDQLFIRAAVFLPGSCDFWRTAVPEPSRLLSIPYLMQYYPVYSHLIFSVFISVNRMTAIVWPAHHVKYWKKIRPASIIFMLMFPLLITWQIYCTKSEFLALRRGTAINAKKLNCPFAAYFRNSIISMVMYAIAGAIIIVTTIVTVYLLYKLPNRRKDAEVQLTIVGIVLAIGTGIDSALQFYFVFYWATAHFSYQYIIRCLATDIPFVCAPWSLLLMSSEVKKEFRKALGMKVIEPLFVPTSTSTTKSFMKDEKSQ